jgi:RNA polymerase sigma-70 factor, ECF subfamily
VKEVAEAAFVGDGSSVAASADVVVRAVDDLYRRYRNDVYRYAFALLGNHADAEDVTQSTFLNAYRALEQGVRPRKPSSWLLAIATNVVRQRSRYERGRPQEPLRDGQASDAGPDDAGPTVGELLVALSRIPPRQRQAIVLREFEGRSYKEIAEILGVTTSALETLLFRARRSLADELENELTCTQAQLDVSRLADGRIGRKERRRLRRHLAECPDCARFARLQPRNRRAFRGLALVPVPVSLTLHRALEGTATAATVPALAATAAGTTASAGGGGLLAGGVALKTAAVVTAASVAGGVGVVGAAEVDDRDQRPGERLGQVAPRGGVVPGGGVAVGRRPETALPGRRVGQAGLQGAPSAKVGRGVGRLVREAPGRRATPGPPASVRSTPTPRRRATPGPAGVRGRPLSSVSRRPATPGRSESVRPRQRPPNANDRGSDARVRPSAGRRPAVERRG